MDADNPHANNNNNEDHTSLEGDAQDAVLPPSSPAHPPNSLPVLHSETHSYKAFAMTRDIVLLNNQPSFLKNNRVVHHTSSISAITGTYGHSSTPASPEESEHRTRSKVRNSPLFHSPLTEKKSIFWETSSGGGGGGSGFVRSSKSEDHLQKTSLSTVSIDIEEDMASSLNTLLDTKSSWTPTSTSYKVPTSPVTPGSPPPSLKSASSSSESPIKTASFHKTSIKTPSEPLAEKALHSNSLTSSDSPTIIKDSTINEVSNEEPADSTSDLVSTLSSSEEAENLPDSELNSPSLDTPACGVGINISIENHHDYSNPSLLPNLKEMLCESANQQGPERTAAWCMQNCCVQMNINEILGDCNHLKNVDYRNPSISPFENNFEWPPKADTLRVVPGSPDESAASSTVEDVPYEELNESHDEESVVDEASVHSGSPPTDDESDIESLHSFHYSPKAVDMPSASRLAKRLYNLEGFKKSDVSRHLSKNNDFSRVVAEEYLKYFDFTGDTLDIALRKFLRQFCLIGETQERERVLVHFSKRYLDCNPGAFRSLDAAHTLTCALMLLNTDLHGENLMRKMTCGEFIENLADMNDGENFPRDVLKSLYQAIKTQPLDWALNEEEKKSNQETQPQPEARTTPSIGHNPFLEVPNPNCATEYKKGYVMRKCCVDPNGKRTPIGKRGWKMLYATLRDLVLYLHKDEHGFKKNQLYDSLHNSIRIHHALAVPATDYTKKQHVFRLHTADQSQYLFQTSDPKELQHWIDTINLVAASLSAPPLASAVGSQKKFQRPLLPVSHTRFNLREQLQDHENRILWLEKELEEHLGQTPDKFAKSRFLQEFNEKDNYLQFELTRYKTYVYLLRSKMAQYPELELSLVETPIGEVDEPGDKGGELRRQLPPPSSRGKHSHHHLHSSTRGRTTSTGGGSMGQKGSDKYRRSDS